MCVRHASNSLQCGNHATICCTFTTPGTMRVFRPQARFIGILEWTCPVCCVFNRTQFKAGSWFARCRQCKRTYAIGVRMCTMPSGNRRRPPDGVIPDFMRATIETDSALTFAEVCEWSTGKRVHTLDDSLVDNIDSDIPSSSASSNPSSTSRKGT